jgi:hypothetical protein
MEKLLACGCDLELLAATLLPFLPWQAFAQFSSNSQFETDTLSFDRQVFVTSEHSLLLRHQLTT